MDASFQCSSCGAEMFEGAHFCMACGSPMGQTAASSHQVSHDLHEGRSVDDEWDTTSKATESLVPEDDLEIEEIDPTGAGAREAEGGAPAQRVLDTLRQVRDYLIELDLDAQSATQCLDVCRNVMSSLNGATRGLNVELSEACRELALALDQAASGKLETMPAQLAQLKAKYAGVAELLPELGEFDSERRHRVELIVRAILEQVPGLGPLQRKKLADAGLANVGKLCRASQADLEAAGLARELAARVSERIQRFNRRLNSIPPEADRAAERQRLRRLTNLLKQQNHKFEVLADDWAKDSQNARRQVRDERAETMSQVSLLLARLGELGIAERIEKLPFDKKACELERLLGTLDDAHGQISLIEG